MHSCAAAPEGRQRHFARLEVRQSLTEALTCPARFAPPCPSVCAASRSLLAAQSEAGDGGRAPVARRAHATKARMGEEEKNGRTWGEISVNVQSPGQPGRRERLTGTDVAHGSSARMWRTDVTVRQKAWRRSKDCGGVDAGKEPQVGVQTG